MKCVPPELWDVCVEERIVEDFQQLREGLRTQLFEESWENVVGPWRTFPFHFTEGGFQLPHCEGWAGVVYQSLYNRFFMKCIFFISSRFSKKITYLYSNKKIGEQNISK